MADFTLIRTFLPAICLVFAVNGMAQTVDSLQTAQPVRSDSLIIDLSGRNHWINDSNTRSWVALGAVAVTGTAAVILKKEANAAYGNYRRTLNSENLKSANSYDLYSGLSLIALQLSVGWLLYELNNREER